MNIFKSFIVALAATVAVFVIIACAGCGGGEATAEEKAEWDAQQNTCHAAGIVGPCKPAGE